MEEKLDHLAAPDAERALRAYEKQLSETKPVLPLGRSELPWRKRFTHYTDGGLWVGELVSANGSRVCEYLFEADADLILQRVGGAA